jgi:hypothetical protein
MREIETDYLIIGAGVSGMAFADTLVKADPDVEVVLVDRRHRPGGHWLDAYPFVRLHQPSAYYGVESTPLGHDRIDRSGPNAGFYERATAAEIVDYFGRVLDEVLLPTGRVRFFGLHDDVTADDAAAGPHRLVSLLTGEETTVRVRRKVVDATYVASEIPSRHTPGFGVDAGVRLVPPNDLVHLAEPLDRVTVIGAGKTAMDTCVWLLENGVAAVRIRWLRTRDPWLFDRTFMQPLDLVGSYMQLQGSWVEAAASAEDGQDFARRMEADGVLVRIDPDVTPEAFRGATISRLELDALRSIEHVVRCGRVTALGERGLATTAGGDLEAQPGEVFVDCTAAGVPPSVPRPIFDGDRITLQYVTIGVAPWSAATVAFVETTSDDDAHKNGLCPPVVFTGYTDAILDLAFSGMSGLAARSMDPAVGAWDGACRLNPARAARDHLDDPAVSAGFARIGQHLGAAIENLQRKVAAPPDAPPSRRRPASVRCVACGSSCWERASVGWSSPPACRRRSATRPTSCSSIATTPSSSGSRSST